MLVKAAVSRFVYCCILLELISMMSKLLAKNGRISKQVRCIRFYYSTLHPDLGILYICSFWLNQTVGVVAWLCFFLMFAYMLHLRIFYFFLLNSLPNTIHVSQTIEQKPGDCHIISPIHVVIQMLMAMVFYFIRVVYTNPVINLSFI